MPDDPRRPTPTPCGIQDFVDGVTKCEIQDYILQVTDHLVATVQPPTTLGKAQHALRILTNATVKMMDYVAWLRQVNG